MAPLIRPTRSISCIPELICMICDYATRASHVQLACSSRSFFQAVIPHIWRDLKGVENLFSLIPGVHIDYSPPRLRIIIPETSSPDFSRYNIYSPLVFSLDIFGSPWNVYQVVSWTTLMEYSQTLGHTLLPNLKQLTIDSMYCSLVDRTSWITVFLTSSLLDIQHPASTFAPFWLGIPDSRAAALLRLIVRRCPNLKSLSIFPESDLEVNQTEQDTIPSMSSIGFYECVANMRHLRALTVGKSALRPDLIVRVGLLPTLEQLTVYISSSWLISNAPLPALLFPSLRHLTLRVVNSFDIWQIWGIETLVRHLTHVQIDVTRSGTADRQGNEQTGLTGWFPQLFHNSPHILSLSIGFHDVPFWPFKTGPRTMMKLPLQCLTLKTVKIGDFEVFCEQLAASCPGLRQLRIPDHSLVLSELFLLTRLKQLESLNVRVEFLGLPERAGLSWEHSAGALTSLEYENIPLASNPKKCDPNITASEIAGYLLTIWPNLVYFAPAIGSNACWATPVHRDVTRIIPRVRAALECSCSLCTRRTNQT